MYDYPVSGRNYRTALGRRGPRGAICACCLQQRECVSHGIRARSWIGDYLRTPGAKWWVRANRACAGRDAWGEWPFCADCWASIEHMDDRVGAVG